MKSKMLSQAEAEAKEILTSAEKEASSIKEENKKRLDSFSKDEKQKIESEVNLLITKELASAQMEARKIYLDEREEIINEIINDSLTKIKDEKSYSDFIEKNIKEFSPSLKKDFIILCNKDDISLVNKIITKLKLKADVQENNISAGIILQGSGLKVNLSLSAILDEKIKDVRQKIIEMIEK